MDYSEAMDCLTRSDPAMARLIEAVGPCRLHLARENVSLLPALGSAIIYQQLSGKAAGTIEKRFLALYPGPGYPSAAELLETPDETLRSVGLSGQKSRYLKDLAAKVQAGLPTVEELEQLEDEEIIKVLTQVKGIGRWTVQMMLIFRLGRPDVWPVDDLGVRAGVRRIFGLEEMPDKKEMDRRGELWRPWRSIAAWYLWRSLELEKTG